MIDLHTHTTASDGTLSPPDLLRHAREVGLEALAITDHDTLAGYDHAAQQAESGALDLICGIEMSSKYLGRSVHLLGYFPQNDPGAEFRSWLQNLQDSRHRRNRELIEKLQAAGFNVTLDEWYARGGTLPGRPHLAAILLEKGYITSIQEAFDKYLAESGEHYTSRIEPQLQTCIELILRAGGVPVLPHPGRVSREPETISKYVAEMRDMGLCGIEVHHSDHDAADRELYAGLAQRLGLLTTGGSDFHGSTKPKVSLGTGIGGNVQVPRELLDNLRKYAAGT